MEYFVIYAAVALAAAFSSIYELVWPVIQHAQEQSVDNEFTRHPYLSLFIVLVVNTIIAPFWLVVLFVPSFSIAATIGMSTVIMTDSKIDT